MKRILFTTLAAIGIFFVLLFPQIEGDDLLAMSDATNRMLLDALGENNAAILMMTKEDSLLLSNPEFGSMLPTTYGYEASLEVMNERMQDLIHIILFFVLTIACLYLTKSKDKTRKPRMLLVVLSLILFGFVSELYQNGVEERGFEVIDVVTNTMGVFLGTLAYRIGSRPKRKESRTARRNLRRGTSPETVIIRTLSGEEFLR